MFESAFKSAFSWLGKSATDAWASLGDVVGGAVDGARDVFASVGIGLLFLGGVVSAIPFVDVLAIPLLAMGEGGELLGGFFEGLGDSFRGAQDERTEFNLQDKNGLEKSEKQKPAPLIARAGGTKTSSTKTSSTKNNYDDRIFQPNNGSVGSVGRYESIASVPIATSDSYPTDQGAPISNPSLSNSMGTSAIVQRYGYDTQNTSNNQQTPSKYTFGSSTNCTIQEKTPNFNNRNGIINY